MFGNFSAKAGGNIAPCRFVTLGTSSGEKVVTQSTANAKVWGVSGQGTRRIALSGFDDGYHAIAGENCTVFGPGGDDALLELAEAVTEHGAELQSDGSGKGVLATTDKDHVGAIAMQTGAVGDIIRVKVVKYDLAA